MRMTDVMTQGESLSIHDGLAFVLGRPDFRAQVAHCFSCIVFEHQEAGRKMLQAHQHDMVAFPNGWCKAACFEFHDPFEILRSEEHTSELQSRENLVCRLLLEKKNN